MRRRTVGEMATRDQTRDDTAETKRSGVKSLPRRPAAPTPAPRASHDDPGPFELSQIVAVDRIA